MSQKQLDAMHLQPLRVVALSAIVLGLASCSAATTAPEGSTTPQTQATPEALSKLKVATTILPITQFTKAVAGDRAEVTPLLPTNVGPHDYQAKPGDARTLAEADVLVKNGLELEAFLDPLVVNAGNPTLKVIDTSEGIPTIATEELEGQEHAKTEKPPEAEVAQEEGHEHGEVNPHLWLDPQRAIQQVENIRDGLVAADPEGKDTYTANAAAYIGQLKALNTEFEKALKPYAGKEFVTYHDFGPYFAQSYGLKAEFLVGVPEENPAPADVQRVMKAVAQSQLKTLLTEPQAAGNPFETLAKDLKVRVSNFDPMETSGPEGLEPDYYFSVMRQNLKNLQSAFGGQSVQSRLPLWTPARAFAVLVSPPVGLSW